MPERKIFTPLTSSDVCETYNLLYGQGLVSFPPPADARAKIDALVTSITGSYFGVEPYPTNGEKALAYLYFLINDHPFTDGNKRTAVLVFLTLCALNELSPRFEGFAPDQLAVFFERTDIDHAEVIRAAARLLFGA
jgi:prophage maintenance system killer protein